MKYIVAIIQPDRLNDVLDELDRRDIHMATVTQVMGCGRQKGVAEVYRGHKEAGRLLRKVKLEIAVNEDFVEPTLEAIRTGSNSGNIGDGKVFVLELGEVLRLRTGERGSVAIG